MLITSSDWLMIRLFLLFSGGTDVLLDIVPMERMVIWPFQTSKHFVINIRIYIIHVHVGYVCVCVCIGTGRCL